MLHLLSPIGSHLHHLGLSSDCDWAGGTAAPFEAVAAACPNLQTLAIEQPDLPRRDLCCRRIYTASLHLSLTKRASCALRREFICYYDYWTDTLTSR